jgi:magnesium chelatase family protein
MSTGESSKIIRERVIAARNIQLKRQNKLNYELNNQEIIDYCVIEQKGLDLLKHASERFGLSARSYYRLIKVSRTLADIEDKEFITEVHIAQSMQYRVAL